MARSAGIYLGIDFVDLVLVETSKEKPRVIKSIRNMLYVDAETPPATQEDKLALIAKAIEKTLQTPAIKINSLNFSIPQDESIIRRFKMQYLPIEERTNAVKFEAQKYLPFKIDDTISDFYIVEESKDTKAMDALFVAVNKQTMERYKGLFKELKVKLNIIDIMPMALLRFLSACKKIKEGRSQLVVYVEKDARGSIIITQNNNPYLVREVGLSASRETFFENILNNLRLSVDYFKRETKEIGVEKILLCGEGHLSELETFLKENIAATEIEIFELNDEMGGLNDLSKKQIVAIGLAMASFEKPRPKINLTSQFPQLDISKIVIEYKPLLIESGVIVLIFILLQILLSVNLGGAKRNLVNIKSQRPAIKDIDADIPLDVLTNAEKGVKSRLEFFKNLVGENRLFLTRKLNYLGRLLPEGAWIESFQFSDEVDRSRGLKIEGMIYSAEKNETAIANKILTDMKQAQDFSFGFDEIKIGGLRKTSAYDKEVLAFSIECSGKPISSPEAIAKRTVPE